MGGYLKRSFNIILLITVFASIILSSGAMAAGNPSSETTTDVNARVGNQFKLVTPDMRMRSCNWYISKEPDPKVVKFLPHGILNADGSKTWNFKATGPGKTTAEFQYINMLSRDPKARVLTTMKYNIIVTK